MKYILTHCVLLGTIFTFHTSTTAQIIFDHDTTLTGTHYFEQFVGVYDSSVTVYVEGADLFFLQGMDIEYATIYVRFGSNLFFHNGYALTVARNALLVASHNSKFQGMDTPVGISFWKCRAYIDNCEFSNVKLSVMETWGDTITTSPTFKLHYSLLNLSGEDPNPIVFSQGVNLEIFKCSLQRVGETTTGQYPNIHLQSNKYSRIESNNIWYGGVSAGSILNSNIEIIDNYISIADKGISFWGVKSIEWNIIENVDIGIEGGTISNKVNNVSIQHNDILNISGQAIDLVGDNLLINENQITGNEETGKGIILNQSSGSLTYNMISRFRINETTSDIDGIALYIKNSTPVFEVRGNMIESCGLSDIANPNIVCSIVYLESKVNFVSNYLSYNTLGGRASPTNSYAGGPILDIVSPWSGSPIVLKNNLIYKNNFIATGVYEPTNTRGSLVAVDFDTRIEFNGNFFWGDNTRSLGVALFPNFSGGIVGDSLLFEENSITNNLVGIGTMQTPDLGIHNIIKNNTDYNIMRYGNGVNPTLYALYNNWDSDDSVAIDNKLFDNEEGINTGPINFGNYYSISYDINVVYTAPTLFQPGDSLEFTIEVNNLLESSLEGLPVFISSSNPTKAHFKLNAPVTGSDGRVNVMLYAINEGTTNIEVFAGDKKTDPIEVSVGNASTVNNHSAINQVKAFSLQQNYPNPFNSSTIIKYELRENAQVVLKVFDVLGREIKTLVYGELYAGSYEHEFDASKLTSGIYFLRLQIGESVDIKKMVLMK